MNEETLFLTQLESDVAQWRKLHQDFLHKSEQRKIREAEYDARSMANVADATKGFSDKLLQFLPFKANDDAFEVGLQSAVDCRVAEIAQAVGCDIGDAAFLVSAVWGLDSACLFGTPFIHDATVVILTPRL